MGAESGLGARPIFEWSQFAGGITRDALLAGLTSNLGTWAQNPAMYELGSTTIPGRLFSSLARLTPIERGEAIFRQLGWGGLCLSRYAARADWAKTIPSLGTPGGMDFSHRRSSPARLVVW